MKSFKEYIIESKQTYEFKIKIAGDHADGCKEKIQQALTKFNVVSCSEAKRGPIQEMQADFPEHTHINVTTCEVVCEYPATSQEVRDRIAEVFDLTHMCVKVRSEHELQEEELNHEHDKKSGVSLLSQDYEKENNQTVVGEKHLMSLLKELNKEKHQGTQVKGVNDKLLAKKSPTEKGPAAKAADKSINNKSAIGGQKIKLPTAGDTK